VNVTLLKINDFKRAFVDLPEETGVHNLENSEGLKEDMTALFNGLVPTNSLGSPYLGQLEEQDPCLVQKGCMFKLGWLSTQQ
jgi:hypothetical protein